MKCAKQREEPIQRPGAYLPYGKWRIARCDHSEERELARDVIGWVVMVFWGLMKELKLHLAGKGTHEVIRQPSDKATFVS